MFTTLSIRNGTTKKLLTRKWQAILIFHCYFIASIKQKLNNLRTRFGKELSKERNTKSGQATEELYNSNWPFFDQLAFLTPVIGASKSRDTLKRMSVYNVMMIMKMWLSHPKRGSPPSLKKNLIFSKNAQMLSLPTKQIVPIV